MTLRTDIATGETMLDRVDLRFGGALPLVLMRRYRSGARGGIFGRGWEHGLDRTLSIGAGRVVYRDGAGRETVFAPVGVGMEARHPQGLTLQHHADVWVVFASPLVQDVFRKVQSGATLPLERIVNPNGSRVKLEYSDGRLMEITGAVGERVRFAYARSVVGQIVVVGGDGRTQAVRTFQYGADGTLAAETDAEGRTTEYTYDRGLLVRVGTPGGHAWLAQYDGDRRCTALWRSDGTAVHHIAYDALRQTTRTVGMDGRQTLYRHAIGTNGSVVLERIDTEAESINYQYDEAQQLIGYADAGGTLVTFQRCDAEGGEHFQVDRERRLWNATLGPGLLIRTIEGADEGEFELVYDERFNLMNLTTPLGATWTFERDARGRTAAVVSPTGRRVAIHRDGSKLAIEGNDGLRHHIILDLLGRVAVRTDRLQREQRFRYGLEGRLLHVEAGDKYRVSCDYDTAGRPIRFVDSERREVRWTRDGAGRPLGLDTDRGSVRFAHDLAGRIRNVSGEAGEVTFSYDAQDRLRSARGVREMTWSYEGDQVVVAVEGERRVFSTHGEPLEEPTPDGGTRVFTYGTAGELILLEQEGGDDKAALYFTYDDDGRLTEVSGDDDATFSYDRDGLLTQVEADSEVFGLGYDVRSRPSALHVGDDVFHLTFDDGDRLNELKGPGQTCTLRYDELDRCIAYQIGKEGEQLTSEGSVGQVPLGEKLVIFTAPRGVVLAALAGSLILPLWGREEIRVPTLRIDARIVRALVRGPEAVLASPQNPGPPLEQWRRLASAEGLDAGVPSTAMLGVPWPALDFFALARDRYDPYFARRIAGALPAHQQDPDRAPDDALTGSHRSGVLQQGVWAERAHGSHLVTYLWLAPAGGIRDLLAFRLYQRLTRS